MQTATIYIHTDIYVGIYVHTYVCTYVSKSMILGVGEFSK